ncbi:MAG: beta-galactosidase, partial [Rhodanobacteraceae bacterium]
MLAANEKRVLPEVPATPPTVTFASLTPRPFASLWDNLPEPRHVDTPRANELLFGQGRGLVLYRREVRGGGKLEVDGVRDYATVSFGGQYLDSISRVVHASLPSDNSVALPATDAGAVLDILVDSFGHVGYGHAMADRKGIL